MYHHMTLICDPPPRNDSYCARWPFSFLSFFFFCVFSESKFYAIYNGEDHFQIRELVSEVHVFECGGTTFVTFEKTCFKC